MKSKSSHKTIKHKKKEESYKDQLLEVNKEEEKFDKLFDKKLSEQYKEFRNLKDHSLQIKKFVRIFAVIMVIILIALLILSYST